MSRLIKSTVEQVQFSIQYYPSGLIISPYLCNVFIRKPLKLVPVTAFSSGFPFNMQNYVHGETSEI